MKKSNLDIKDDLVILSINPKVYPLDVIYSAAYVFLDGAYILLDGDPKKEIFVELKPKEGGDKQELEKLGREFYNELINYSDYKKRAQNTKKIREILLQRALITNDPSVLGGEFEDLMEESEDDDYLEDPEGIAIPWEEKYGAKVKKDENKTK